MKRRIEYGNKKRDTDGKPLWYEEQRGFQQATC